MKIEWMTQSQTTDTPAIAFGFDDVSQLVEGRLTVSWLNEGGSPVRLHNLVISDTGADAETLGKAVIRATEKPFAKYRKGSLKDGTARDVYPIFNDPALPFRAGLTVHAARGTWSSLPHKFEREEILNPRPMPFFERFAYVTDPPGTGGYQVRIGHLWPAGGSVGYATYRWGGPDSDITNDFINDIVAIRDRDILDIPLGSHRVTGDAGVRLCYFWAYWTDPATPWVMTMREKF
jgi:hypothetical protein